MKQIYNQKRASKSSAATMGLALLAAAIGFGTPQTSQAQEITPVWSITAPNSNWFGTGNTERGLTYNPATGNLIVASRQGGVTPVLVNSATGDSVGVLDNTGIAGGTFAFNQIRATADGQIFTANLTVNAATSNVKIYRWANETAAPALIYDDTMTNADGVRYGDALGAWGAGDNVVLLLSGTNPGVIAQFQWDGSALTKTAEFIVEPNVGRGGFSHGVYTDPGSGNNFVLAAGTGAAPQAINLADGTTLQAYSSGDVEATDLNSVMLIDGINYLGDFYVAAGPAFTNGLFYMFRLEATGNATLLTQFGPLGANANTNNTGGVIFDADKGYVYLMDTNNALIAIDAIAAIVATSTEETDNETVRGFELSQNYPNPFNPTTNIRFNLAASTEVTLEVFNMVGQQVATLVAGERMAQGSHEVTFDASDLGSGIYHYRIVAGSFVSQKSMVLLK